MLVRGRGCLFCLLLLTQTNTPPKKKHLQATLTTLRRLTGDALGGFGGGSQLTSLLGSTFGAGLSSLTKGVKNLLAGEQQAAVTVAVEALMDGKPSPDTDAYAVFDPKARRQGLSARWARQGSLS